MDAIYRESFAIAERMLDPDAADARYVTTAIHVKREVRPEWLLDALVPPPARLRPPALTACCTTGWAATIRSMANSKAALGRTSRSSTNADGTRRL